MKKSIVFSMLLGAGILFAFSGSLNAQKRIVDEKEFYRARDKAWATLYERQRRVKTTEDIYENGLTLKTTSTIYEYLAEDRNRFFKKVLAGGQSVEQEEIKVGHFLYTRENGGAWSKIDLRTQPGTGTGTGSGAGYTALQQTTVESVFLGSWPTELYELVTVKRGKSGLDMDEERAWFGQDGSLLRQETIEGSFSPRNITRKFVKKYEYDPKIKIEAPIP